MNDKGHLGEKSSILLHLLYLTRDSLDRPLYAEHFPMDNLLSMIFDPEKNLLRHMFNRDKFDKTRKDLYLAKVNFLHVSQKNRPNSVVLLECFSKFIC